MATPIKQHERICFPDKEICVSCCLKNRQRYFIVRNDKSHGPAFDIVSYCYQRSLSIDENVGTFVCVSCFKLLQRLKDMDNRRSQLYEKVMSSSQSFRAVSVKKRHATATPGTARKSKLPDHRSTPCHTLAMSNMQTPEKETEDSLKKVPKPPSRNAPVTKSLFQSPTCTGKIDALPLAVPLSPLRITQQKYSPASDSLKKVPKPPSRNAPVTKSLFQSPTCTGKIDTLPLAVPLSPLKITQQKYSPASGKKKLKHTVSFRSLKLSENLLPVIKSIANGSVTKAVTLLLNSKDAVIKKNAMKSIQNCIDKECSIFSKLNLDTHLRKTDINELENFDLKKIQEDFQKHAPLLWACASQAATSTYSKTLNCVKVCAALCVLIQGRSRILNSLQHVVAISMYNNQLQKEGFLILAKLGFSVSHITVNATLNKAKAQNENVMKTYQKNLTEFIVDRGCSDMVEDEHSYTIVGHSSSSTNAYNEHSYATHHPEPLVGAPLGYRFNLDNLDFHIKVREMTQEHQNVTRHFTQIMAIIDRVNCENLSDEPVGDLITVENSEFFPSAEDNYTLRKDMIQVVSNILVDNMSSFQVFKGIYSMHFQHVHSDEMAKKSTVVYV